MRHARLFTVLIFTLITLFCTGSCALLCAEPLSFASMKGEGTDAVLVLDVSGSMMRSDPQYQCREAALSFARELSASGSARAAVITFSDQIVFSSSFMDLDEDFGMTALSDCLNTVSYTRGDTDIGTALKAAEALLLGESSPDRLGCILLLTDGEIDLPKAADEETAENESLAKALVAVEDSARSGIAIHTVMLDPDKALDPYLCRYIAQKTGGSFSEASDPSALPELFGAIARCASSRALEMAALSSPQTEAQTEPETETETEVMTETEEPPRVILCGSVDGPILLEGLIPGMCSASLDLSDLFEYTSSDPLPEGADSTSLQYSASSSSPATLACSIDKDTLHLAGMRKGSATVTLRARAPWGGSFTDCEPVRFEVTVRPLLPSGWVIPAACAIASVLLAALLLAVHLLHSSSILSGSLEWFVRAEGEKIYGVPSRTRADLEVYGRKVSLLDLIDDELLEDVRLDKVKITPARSGIRISSHTARILLTAPGMSPCRSLELADSAGLTVLCQTQQGRVSVLMQYFLPEDMDENEYADGSEERTRILIPDDRRMAG